jgi:nitroreductase
MELYEVMRSAFSAREFTSDPVPPDLIERVLEHARFAPSGGNRQGWHVIAVRDPATMSAIADLAVFAAKRYTAQVRAGENPWNTVHAPGPTAAEIEATSAPPGLIEPTRSAPVLLVVCVDLGVVASVDQDLERVGIISGASIYPFAWNILLALRNEGYGGVLTTMPIAREPALKELLGLPLHVAVAAVMPIGKPVAPVSKLRRKPVSAFFHEERW